MKVMKRVFWLAALMICSPSMKPNTPSDGVAILTTGPPAALTRKSVPRFSMAIHAEPSASARTESEFCDTSLRNAGLADLRKSCAREISAVVMLYGDLAPVARPAIAIRSVGWLSATTLPAYLGSVRTCHEVGAGETCAGL